RSVRGSYLVNPVSAPNNSAAPVATTRVPAFGPAASTAVGPTTSLTTTRRRVYDRSAVCSYTHVPPRMSITTADHGSVRLCSSPPTPSRTPTRCPGLYLVSRLSSAKYRSTVAAIGLADGGASTGRASRSGPTPERAPTRAKLLSSDATSPA